MKIPGWAFGLAAGIGVWYFWSRGRGEKMVFGRVPGSGLPGPYLPSGMSASGSLSGGEAPAVVNAPQGLGQTQTGSR